MPRFVLPKPLQKRWNLEFLLFALIKLAGAYFLRPLLLLNAPHDDTLQYAQADALQCYIKSVLTFNHEYCQQWLGGYNVTTLIKVPGYVMFLAFNHFTRLPLLVTQEIFYLLACFLALRFVRQYVKSRWLLLLLTVLLVFNPFSQQDLRVYRFDLSSIAAWLTIAVLLQLFLQKSLRGILVWSFLGGLSLGFFYLQREEGLAIFPSIGLLWLGIALALTKLFKQKQLLTTLASAVFIYLLGFGLFYGTPILLNGLHYGRFSLSEDTDPAYSAAVNALMSIQIEQPRKYVLIPREARTQLYRVSPAFSELRPYFDPEESDPPLAKAISEAWLKISCDELGICDDHSSRVIWLFRDAVEQTGHYRTGAESTRYYHQLADEINIACTDGHLRCQSAIGTSYLPTDFQFSDFWQLTTSIWKMGTLTQMGGAAPFSFNGRTDLGGLSKEMARYFYTVAKRVTHEDLCKLADPDCQQQNAWARQMPAIYLALANAYAACLRPLSFIALLLLPVLGVYLLLFKTKDWLALLSLALGGLYCAHIVIYAIVTLQTGWAARYITHQNDLLVIWVLFTLATVIARLQKGLMLKIKE